MGFFRGIARESIPTKWNKSKHSQLKWMTLEGIDMLNTSECVQDFKNYIQIVNDLWNHKPI